MDQLLQVLLCLVGLAYTQVASGTRWLRPRAAYMLTFSHVFTFTLVMTSPLLDLVRTRCLRRTRCDVTVIYTAVRGAPCLVHASDTQTLTRETQSPRYPGPSPRV